MAHRRTPLPRFGPADCGLRDSCTVIGCGCREGGVSGAWDLRGVSRLTLATGTLGSGGDRNDVFVRFEKECQVR